jgi:GNAT superfamily N-acetyltransferase
MNLKIASIEDLEDIVDLMVTFKVESPYSTLSTDIEKIRTSVLDGLNKDKKEYLILLSYSEDFKDKGPIGIIIGSIQEFPFSLDKQAYEHIWYVLPKYRKNKVGLELYEAFEYWAIKLGVKVIHSAYPSEDLKTFYLSKGYKPLERVYYKIIDEVNT